MEYGAEDGFDTPVHKSERRKKKYSTAVWMFFLFGIAGGHRLYVGDYLRAFACYILACVALEFIALPFKWANKFQFGMLDYVLGGLYYGVYIIIIIWEFRSIRPSIERVNKEIEAENSD